MSKFGVTEWRVRWYNLSVSDQLMDTPINNDSTDLLNMATPAAADESICGKLSHTMSLFSRNKNRNASLQQHKERRFLMYILLERSTFGFPVAKVCNSLHIGFFKSPNYSVIN